MGFQNPLPNWSDPELLAAIEQAFDATWPVLRAHETCADKARMADLSMKLSHKLIELAAEGIRDPQQLRKLALETFSTELRIEGTAQLAPPLGLDLDEAGFGSRSDGAG